MSEIDFRNNRYAFEWFMREEDKRYWDMTKNLINKKAKKIAALAIAGTAISGTAIIISFFSLHRKSV